MPQRPAGDDSKVLRAIHANAGIEAWYRSELQKLIRAMFQSMLLHARAAYRSNDPEIGFASDDDPIARLRKSLDKWGKQWTGKLEAASDDLAARFAKRSRSATDAAFKQRLKDAGFTVEFKTTDGMRRAYKAVIAEQVNLIRRIPAQFLTDVQSAVWSSVMKGGGMGELTKQIQKRYGIEYRHAALIARDQNNKAKAIMEEQRRSELGITEAIWQHSGGGREPRPTHVAMSGKAYRIARGMYDSAVKKRIWPGTEINCRCTSKAVIPGLPKL